MFAGPNGSGKSTFIKAIQQECSIGFYINADDIEYLLKTKGNLCCSSFIPEEISQVNWDTFITANEGDMRYEYIKSAKVTIKNNILYVLSTELNSYVAAFIAEFFRYQLLNLEKSFSFETVMSHSSKVNFLHEAKEKGFKTYLYFICTSDPEINKSRVKLRVSKGGHDVAEDKIEKRYYASLDLLKDAFLAVDRAYICDSSIEGEEQSILFEKNGEEVKFHKEIVPQWILDYLINHIIKI